MGSNLKVLHVIGPTELGGAQTQLLGLVRAAHGRYWDASVCSTAAGALLPAFKDLAIPLLELRRRASPGVLRVTKLRNYIANNRFDVVHSMLWHCNAYARLAVAGRKDRPATVISERGVEPRFGAKVVVDRRLARYTDLWIGNSEAVQEFILRLHPAPRDAVLHIPNAIDKSLFCPAENRTAGTGPLIGSIGRLEPEKGWDVLLSACRNLQRDLPNLRLKIAGIGPLEGELRELAADLPVTFCGALAPGRAVADFLRTLDLFVLPARRGEGRSNVLMEALSCGVPVVATQIPGISETIGEGGVLVPADKPTPLAEAMIRVLSDPSARSRAVDAARGFPSFQELAQCYKEAFELAQQRHEVL